MTFLQHRVAVVTGVRSRSRRPCRRESARSRRIECSKSGRLGGRARFECDKRTGNPQACSGGRHRDAPAHGLDGKAAVSGVSLMGTVQATMGVSCP